MQKILILILVALSICRISSAQSLEDKRRIEEGKRKDLLSSERYPVEMQEAGPLAPASSRDVYFSALLSKEAAVLSDAYRTLAVLTGVDGQFRSPDSQYNFFKKEGMLPESIGTEPNYNMPLRKGVAAYMFAKAMDIKGGIVLRLFGVNQRYAFKELVHEEIMPPGNVNDVMSGKELMITLAQAADYMAEQQERMQRRRRP